MKIKNWKVYLAGLVLFLSILGCQFTDSLGEKTTINIVKPISGYRDTREFGKTEYVLVAMSVLVESNKRNGEVVDVFFTWNGSNPVVCKAIVNTVSPCGELPMYQMGQQTLHAEVETINGTRVSDDVVFVWEPVTGLFDTVFLKTAQMMQSQNPTAGMVAIVAFFILIFAAVVGIKVGNFNGTLIVFVISVIVCILVYSYMDAKEGLKLFEKFFALIGSSFVIGFFAYLINRGYTARGKNKAVVRMFDPYGNPLEFEYHEGAQIGPGANSTQGGQVVSAFMGAITQQQIVAQQQKQLAARAQDIQYYEDGVLVDDPYNTSPAHQGTYDISQYQTPMPRRAYPKQKRNLLLTLFGAFIEHRRDAQRQPRPPKNQRRLR